MFILNIISYALYASTCLVDSGDNLGGMWASYQIISFRMCEDEGACRWKAERASLLGIRVQLQLARPTVDWLIRYKILT